MLVDATQIGSIVDNLINNRAWLDDEETQDGNHAVDGERLRDHACVG